MSQAEARRAHGTDHLYRSHSVLPATDWLLRSSPGPQSSPSVPADFPPVRRLPWVREPLLSFSFLDPRDAGPIPLPLLFLFPSSFFCPILLHRDLSFPFRYLRYSASVQQVLCENCSICRCILDAFVGRGELHSLLLLHHCQFLFLFMSIVKLLF